MKKPKTPKNEKKRLEDLYRYETLDTQSETCFDEITALAQQVCGTEIALVSLVDSDRQWFKSKKGLDASETPRDISFCGHAILTDDFFQIEDTHSDQRFSDNPLVTGTPHIRFYAGSPLITPSGSAIGTLCVIDSKPKKLSTQQQETLRLLAKSVVQIFELRLKNKALLETNEVMTEFQNVAHIGGWELDLATKKTVWSPEIYNIYGIPLGTPTDEIQGLSYYSEESQHRLVKDLERCITTGDIMDGAYELTDTDGEKKWVRNIGRLIRNSGGEPEKVIGTTQDITDQMERENELIIQRQFLSETLNNMPSMFYTRTARGELLMVNDKFSEFHNCKNKPVVGRRDRDVLGEKNFAVTSVNDSKTLAEGSIVDTEEELFDHQGNKKIFQSFRFPYRDQNGEIYATGCISLDITNKKILESQALHRARLASIGEMAAGAGHEINNPLAIIIGYISKIKKLQAKQDLSDAELSTILEKINRSAFRISKIVSGIRSFSRHEPQETMDFDVVETLRESVNMFQEIFEGEGVKVEFSTPLPFNQYYVEGNRGQIQQILINLMTNAKDAVSKTLNPKIEVHCEDFNDEILIKVADNGSGISKQVQSRIFDPFFTTKAINKGTGLGLSIVHKLVNDHQGSIRIDSEENVGTTFSIVLPVKKDSSKVSNDLQSLADSFELPSLTKEKSILLIDDEIEIRELLKENLTLHDFDVTTAHNGVEGLKLLENPENHFDLILCDIRMPEMDGYEFFQRIQKLDRTLPKFVFITGGVNIDLAVPLADLEKQVDGFLYKPFSHSEILRMLSQVFEEESEILSDAG